MPHSCAVLLCHQQLAGGQGDGGNLGQDRHNGGSGGECGGVVELQEQGAGKGGECMHTCWLDASNAGQLLA